MHDSKLSIVLITTHHYDCTIEVLRNTHTHVYSIENNAICARVLMFMLYFFN